MASVWGMAVKVRPCNLDRNWNKLFSRPPHWPRYANVHSSQPHPPTASKAATPPRQQGWRQTTTAAGHHGYVCSEKKDLRRFGLVPETLASVLGLCLVHIVKRSQLLSKRIARKNNTFSWRNYLELFNQYDWKWMSLLFLYMFSTLNCNRNLYPKKAI